MKDIPGFEGLYACDQDGNIYSLARTIRRSNGKGRDFDWNLQLKKLSSCERNHGYLGVLLRKNNQSVGCLVHRLIGKAYLGLDDFQEINHLDGNKKNNFLNNLQVCSRSENMKHAYKLGLKSNAGLLNPRFRITDEIKISVRSLLNTGLSHVKIGSTVGICPSAVSNIKLNKI